jgi:N12 class adenine-specific DNA methylase
MSDQPQAPGDVSDRAARAYVDNARRRDAALFEAARAQTRILPPLGQDEQYLYEAAQAIFEGQAPARVADLPVPPEPTVSPEEQEARRRAAENVPLLAEPAALPAEPLTTSDRTVESALARRAERGSEVYAESRDAFEEQLERRQMLRFADELSRAKEAFYVDHPEARPALRGAKIGPAPEGREPPPRPGALGRLVEPFKRLATLPARATGRVSQEVRASKLVNKIVAREAAHRRDNYLYTPDQVGQPQALEFAVRQEVYGGFPMFDDRAAKDQEQLYMLWQSLEPEQLPAEAEGLTQKIAEFGGEIGAFIASLRVIRALPGLEKASRAYARRVSPVRHPGAAAGTPEAVQAMRQAARQERVAGTVQETLAAGTLGALEGRDPFQAMVEFAPFAASRYLRPVQRAMTQSALFTFPVIDQSWEDIIVHGVIGPLVFSIPDMVAYPWRPRGIRLDDPAWQRYRTSDSEVERAVYDWMDAVQGAGGFAGRSDVTGGELTRVKRQAARAASELAAAYDRSTQNPSAYSRGERALLREFVRHFRPEEIETRWVDAEVRHEPTTGAREGVRPEGRRPERPGDEAGGAPPGPERGGGPPGGGVIAEQGRPAVRGAQEAPAQEARPIVGLTEPTPGPSVPPPAAPPGARPPGPAHEVRPGTAFLPAQQTLPLHRYKQRYRKLYGGEELPSWATGLIDLRRAGPEDGGRQQVVATLRRLGVPDERVRQLTMAWFFPEVPDRPSTVMEAIRQTREFAKPEEPAIPEGIEDIEVIEAPEAPKPLPEQELRPEPSEDLAPVEGPAEGPVAGAPSAPTQIVPATDAGRRDLARQQKEVTARLNTLWTGARDARYFAADEGDLRERYGNLAALLRNALRGRSVEGLGPVDPWALAASLPESQRRRLADFRDLGERLGVPTGIPGDLLLGLPEGPARTAAEPAVPQPAAEAPERAPLGQITDDAPPELRSSRTELDARPNPRGDRPWTLTHHTAGYEAAGAALRWTDEKWSVRTFQDGAGHGRSFRSESEARDYLDQVAPGPAEPPPTEIGGTLKEEAPHEPKTEQAPGPPAGEAVVPGKPGGPVGPVGPGGAPVRAGERGGGPGVAVPERPAGETTLVEAPTEAVRGPGPERPAVPDVVPGPRADEEGRPAGPPERPTDKPRPAETRPGVAVPGIRGGGAAPGGGERPSRPTKRPGEPPTEPDPTQGPEPVVTHTTPDPGGRDYIISREDRLFESGPKTGAKDNITAIRVAKEIIAADRMATADEQKALVKYVGWGARPQIFDRYRDEWRALHDELRELLTDEEWRKARASTLNAMYTPPEIVSAMYEGLSRLGFTGGSVLEPALGVGHFFGLMPSAWRDAVRRVGIELDSVSGRIGQLLYPRSDVRVSPFEKASLPRDFFDLVISNVPFGKIEIADKRYPPWATAAIHDYYFIRSLDLVRPGGVIAFITSHFTMDKRSSAIRQAIADKADLLGAVRLNEKSLPGTDVIADVMFLRRRRPEEEPSGEAWIESRRLPELRDYYVNEYFHEHPSQVLGTFAPGTMHQRGARVTVKPGDAGRPLLGLSDAVARLPRDVMVKQPDMTAPRDPADLVLGPEAIPRGSYFLHGDQLHYQAETGEVAPAAATVIRRHLKAKEEAKARRPIKPGQKRPAIKTDAEMEKAVQRQVDLVRKQVKLRDAVLSMLQAQATGDEKTWQARQRDLGEQYDAFVRRHGFLHAPNNVRALGDDYHTAAVLDAIEDYNGKTKSGTKADLFTRRVIEPHVRAVRAESTVEALHASLNELGRLDPEYMGQLLGKSADAVRGDAVREGHAFEAPTGQLVLRGEYLSGDVRAKLADARAAAQVDPKFKGNVEALQAVQPEDVGVDRVTAQLASPWIDVEDFRDFARHLFGEGVELVRVRDVGRWSVRAPASVRASVAATTKWGTASRSGPELLGDAMAHRTPTIRVKIGETPGGGALYAVDPVATDAVAEKIKEIKEEFQRWVWRDPGRTERLLGEFNQRYNNLVRQQFDGSYLTLPGLNPLWSLYPYQKDVIAANLQRGRGLNYVPVGGGKTLTFTVTARELIRLGLARKPAIVVQNSTLAQFGRTAQSMYPGHTWIVVTPKMLDKASRLKTLARIATAESAAIIIPHQAFKSIGMSRAETEAYFARQMAELERALEAARATEGSRGLTVKELERALANLEARLEKRLERIERDQGFDFETLGIDFLLYDESQALKNLPYLTQMQKVKGLNPKEGSQAAFDAAMKAEYIQRFRNGRGVVFGTGTPVDNSMVELYALQRFLDPKRLEEREIFSLDDWVGAFATVGPAVEAVGEGGYDEVSRLRDFSNADQFMAMFDDFTVSVTEQSVAETLKALDRPPIPLIAKNSEGHRAFEIITSPSNAEIDAYREYIKQRAQHIREHPRRPTKGMDTIVAVISDNRSGTGVDLKLKVPGATRHPEDKVSAIAREVLKRYHSEEHTRGKLTQVIFLSRGVWKPGEYNTYDELRELLEAGGIPAAEIDYIQKYTKPEEKAALFERFNAGEVRILLTTIASGGIGVNIQGRLKTEILGDPPWTPGQIEQAKGRIVRSGNVNDEVELLAFVQKGSADEFMYSLVFHKWKFQKALLEGRLRGVQKFDDVDVIGAGFEASMADASVSPVVKEWVKAKQVRDHLLRLKTAHDRDQARLTDRLAREQAGLDAIRNELLPAAQRAKRLVKGAGERELLHVMVGHDVFTKPGEAGAELNRVLLGMSPSSVHSPQWQRVAEINGTPIEGARVSGPTFEVPAAVLRLTGTNVETDPFDVHTKLSKQGLAAITSRARRLLDEPSARIESLERRLADHEEAIADGRRELGPFGRAHDLAEATTKEAALGAEVEALGAKPIEIGDEVRLDDVVYEYVRPVDDSIELKEEGTENLVRFPKRDLMIRLKRPFRIPETPDTDAPGGAWPTMQQEGYKPASWLAQVPANQRASLLKWIREHGDRYPGFGMGAMFNFPDVRGRWTRVWDGFADALRNLPPGLRKKVVDAVGRGVWGTERWNVDPDAWRAIERYHGGVRETKFDVRQVKVRARGPGQL